jgi:hypothetical protein
MRVWDRHTDVQGIRRGILQIVEVMEVAAADPPNVI